MKWSLTSPSSLLLFQAQSDFHLIFKRILWYFPMNRFENDLNVDFLFNQALPDFLDGYLVVFEENRFVTLTNLFIPLAYFDMTLC